MLIFKTDSLWNQLTEGKGKRYTNNRYALEKKVVQENQCLRFLFDISAGGNVRVTRVISLPASVQRREMYRQIQFLNLLFFMERMYF